MKKPLFNRSALIEEIKNNEDFDVNGPNDVDLREIGKSYLQEGK